MLGLERADHATVPTAPQPLRAGKDTEAQTANSQDDGDAGRTGGTRPARTLPGPPLVNGGQAPRNKTPSLPAPAAPNAVDVAEGRRVAKVMRGARSARPISADSGACIESTDKDEGALGAERPAAASGARGSGRAVGPAARGRGYALRASVSGGRISTNERQRSKPSGAAEQGVKSVASRRRGKGSGPEDGRRSGDGRRDREKGNFGKEGPGSAGSDGKGSQAMASGANHAAYSTEAADDPQEGVRPAETEVEVVERMAAEAAQAAEAEAARAAEVAAAEAARAAAAEEEMLRARVEAEAAAMARVAAAKQRVKAAGTAFALLGGSEDEASSSEEEANGSDAEARANPDEDTRVATGRGNGENESTRRDSPQAPVAKGKTRKGRRPSNKRPGDQTSHRRDAAGGGVSAVAIVADGSDADGDGDDAAGSQKAMETAALPQVFWGSEESDLAERCAITFTTAVFSKQGTHKSHANEDRYAIRPNVNDDLASHLVVESADAPPVPEGAVPPRNAFFGVYDGHGGSDCANLAAGRIHMLLAEDPVLWRFEPLSALAASFALAEQEMRDNYAKSGDRSGTCALAALLRGSRLHISWVGDCRAVLISDEATYTQLTVDQRSTDSEEQKRIKAVGGEIIDGRVWGALIPSRTLGDFPWKDRDGGKALTSEPATVSIEITPSHKYLVIGSDGLFDVLTNKTIAKLIGRMNSGAQKACNELVKEVKKRPGTDDTTVIVIHFEAP